MNSVFDELEKLILYRFKLTKCPKANIITVQNNIKKEIAIQALIEAHLSDGSTPPSRKTHPPKALWPSTNPLLRKNHIRLWNGLQITHWCIFTFTGFECGQNRVL
jgi:hypothetical protein